MEFPEITAGYLATLRAHGKDATMAKRKRRKRKVATRCKACGGTDFDYSQLAAKNGKIVIRTDCANCGKFVKFGKPRTAAHIRYPAAASEFEIQAAIYAGLKELAYDIRGEVAEGDCRFDLVVYLEDRKPVRIIEVKKYRPNEGPKEHRNRAKQSNQCQLQKYEQFGVPVDVVAGMKNARKYIGWVKRHRFADAAPPDFTRRR
jgi:hypothetical protein